MAATNILEALIIEIGAVVKSNALTQAQAGPLTNKAYDILSAIHPA
jgi:hypothetical protein